MSSFSIAEELTDPILGQWAHGEGRINEEGIDGLVLHFDAGGEFRIQSPGFPELTGTWQPVEDLRVYEIPLPLVKLPPLDEVFGDTDFVRDPAFGKPYLVAWRNPDRPEEGWRFDLVLARDNWVGCRRLEFGWPWQDRVVPKLEGDRIVIADSYELQQISEPPFQTYCLQYSSEVTTKMKYGRAQLRAYVSSEHLFLGQGFTPEERKKLEASFPLSGINLSFHLNESFWKWTEKDRQKWLLKSRSDSKSAN